MTSNFNISIIVPFFNRLDLLDKTIESVLNQTSNNWELILVDDGTDEDLSTLQQKYKLDKISFITKKTNNKGSNHCRNLGASLAKNKHIMFLDSDDLLTPWCIETRTNEILNNRACDLWLFSGVEFDSILKEFTRYRTVRQYEDPLYGFLNFQSVCQTSCAIWTKSVFEDIGGWDESVMSWQDGEIFARYFAKKNNYKWSDCEMPDVLIRKHDLLNRISNTKGMNIDKSNNLIQTYQKVLDYIDEPYFTQFKENITLSLYDQAESIKKHDYLEFSNWIDTLSINKSDKKNIKKYAYVYVRYNRNEFTKRVLYQIRKSSFFFRKRKGFWSMRPTIDKDVKQKLNYLIF